MADEDLMITIEGVQYRRLEDVPEPYRELARKQAASAAAAAEAAARASSAAPGIKIHKDIKIDFKIKRVTSPAGAPPSAAPIVPGGPPFVRWLGFLAAAAALLAWMLLRHR